MTSQTKSLIVKLSFVFVVLCCIAAIGGAMSRSSGGHDDQSAHSDNPDRGRWAVRVVPLDHGREMRLHIVAPDDQWYIIPDAYDEWADEISSGAMVEIPATIRDWPQPFLYNEEESSRLRRGDYILDGSGKDVGAFGVFFFASHAYEEAE